MNAKRTIGITAFALVSALTFALAACGEKSPSPSPEPSTPASGDDAGTNDTPAPGTTSTNGVNPVGANQPPPDAGYFKGGSRHPM